MTPTVTAALVACVVGLLAMVPALLRRASAALLERSAASSRRLEAEAAVINARAAERLADATVRATQARMSEAGATALLEAWHETQDELAAVRERLDHIEQTLRESELARASAEEERNRVRDENAAMRTAFATYHAEINAHETRAGRPPRRTPQAFARYDSTVPFGTGKGTT